MTSTTASAHEGWRPPAKALTTPYLDFWLLGGASVVVWAFMFALEPLRKSSWALDHHYANAFAISNTIALFVNYPHFMASYALAYRRGFRFVRSNWFQLVLVPLLLLTLFSCTYSLFDQPSATSLTIAKANDLFAKLGLRTRLGLTPNVATEVLGLAVLFMLLTVGWHYTKQVYGCMMVYARFDGLSLTGGQRSLLKWNLFGIWWLSFAYFNVSTDSADFFGLRYFRLGLPHVLVDVSAVFLVVTLVAVVFRVFVPLYEQHRRLPSLSMLAPYLAMYLWWIPIFIQKDFYLYLVPIFHSVQYLAFVYKLEHARMEDLSGRLSARRGTAMMVGLVVAGFAFFELFPNSADTYLHTKERLHIWYFFICAQVFINVHHYFIDNVLWRFKNDEMKKYVLQ